VMVSLLDASPLLPLTLLVLTPAGLGTLEGLLCVVSMDRFGSRQTVTVVASNLLDLGVIAESSQRRDCGCMPDRCRARPGRRPRPRQCESGPGKLL